MSEREYFIQKLKKSRNTVISYTADCEKTLDEVFDQIGVHKIEGIITDNLNLDSYLRENIIDSILDNKDLVKFTHLVIHTENINPNAVLNDSDNYFSGISSILISSILDNIYHQLLNKNIKLIILTPFYKTFDNQISSKIKKAVYNADLYLSVNNNQVVIIKDREGTDNIYLNLSN
jgi:hypothetical protein